MRPLNIVVLFALAYLGSFEAAYSGRLIHFLGAPLNILPSLMVYAGLSTGPLLFSALAIASGLGFDALSANPLGVTIAPLFLVAYMAHLFRALLLREKVYAQFVLGAAASFAAPLVTLILLLTLGAKPLFGWTSLFHWIAMALFGAVATPLLFWLFDRWNETFHYQTVAETSFPADREIKRGR